MNRLTIGVGLVWVFAAAPAGLFAQFNAGAGGLGASARPNLSAADPRARRAWREQAVARAGPAARDFVEAMGDDAVAAVFACSPPAAAKLAEFYASGGLGRLPRPADLLRAVAQPGAGDDVCLWAMQHAGELEDADAFEAYVESPLEYALGLKPLAAGAAEARARRLNPVAAAPPAAPAALALPPVSTNELILLGCGVLILIALWVYRRRQKQLQP
ncbi:MAG TPA: hypothetical protein VMS17_27510 [Gemmataceae bacterium]|nr:hypothetical protein [Gemmataceae bacterium]